MAFVNRPPQSYGFCYSDDMNQAAGLASLAQYAHPGGFIIAGRTAYGHQAFKDVAAGGGCVIIYLDPMIDAGYGRYHNYLLGHNENGTPNPLWGAVVPRWPGKPQASQWGYINDFRPGSIIQGKLEGVLEMMVAENPHMGGFFLDDVGSMSYFPDCPWTQFSSTEKQQYRDGAIAFCQTARTVCNRHGLIFMVNGTWGAGALATSGGGYPDINKHGISLADGGYVEHHDASQLPYFSAYGASTQWASASSVTGGVAFTFASEETDADRTAYINSNSFAFVNTQPGDYPGPPPTPPGADYGYPPPPWGPLHATGLPSGVASNHSYTELEWCLSAQAPAVNGEIYQFRVYAEDSPFGSYPVTAQFMALVSGVLSVVTFTATDRRNNKEPGLSVPVTASVASTHLIHLKELVLSVPVVADAAMVDRARFREPVASIPVNVPVSVLTNTLKTKELALALPVAATAVEGVNQVDFHEPNLAVGVTMHITGIDLLQKISQYDETQRTVNTAARITVTDKATFKQLGNVVTVATFTPTDYLSMHETPTVAVAVTIPVTNFLHSQETRSIPTVSRVNLVDQVDYRATASVDIGATVVATDRLRLRAGVDPVLVTAAVGGDDALNAVAALSFRVTSKSLVTDFIPSKGTVLNDADALYLDGDAVLAVYAGEDLVWAA